MKAGLYASILLIQCSLILLKPSVDSLMDQHTPNTSDNQVEKKQQKTSLSDQNRSTTILQACKEIDWATWNSFTGRSAIATINSQGSSVNVTMNSSFEFSSTPQIERYEAFKRSKSPVVNTAVPRTSWSKQSETTTICFSQSVKEPVLLVASLGSYKDRIETTITFSEPYVILYNGGGMKTDNNSTLTGREGYALIKFPGDIKCITISSSSYENFTDLTLGIPVCPEGIPKPALDKAPVQPEPAPPVLASVPKTEPKAEKPEVAPAPKPVPPPATIPAQAKTEPPVLALVPKSEPEPKKPVAPAPKPVPLPTAIPPQPKPEPPVLASVPKSEPKPEKPVAPAPKPVPLPTVIPAQPKPEPPVLASVPKLEPRPEKTVAAPAPKPVSTPTVIPAQAEPESPVLASVPKPEPEAERPVVAPAPKPVPPPATVPAQPKPAPPVLASVPKPELKPEKPVVALTSPPKPVTPVAPPKPVLASVPKPVEDQSGKLKIEVFDFDGMDYDSVSLKLNGKQIGPEFIQLPLYKRYGSPEFTYPLTLNDGNNTLEIQAISEGLKPLTTIGILIISDKGRKKLYFTLKAKESTLINL